MRTRLFVPMLAR